MLRKFTISCEQANAICNKAQYGEATFLEKLKLNFHILICKFCALYSKQNQKLTKVCKAKASEKKENTLHTEEKELLKEKLKNFELK